MVDIFGSSIEDARRSISAGDRSIDRAHPARMAAQPAEPVAGQPDLVIVAEGAMPTLLVAPA